MGNNYQLIIYDESLTFCIGNYYDYEDDALSDLTNFNYSFNPYLILLKDMIENRYIVIAKYNKKKHTWDKINSSWYSLHLPTIKDSTIESNMPDVETTFMDIIYDLTNFTDVNILKQYIIESMIYSNMSISDLHSLITAFNNKSTVGEVVKYCWDKVLSLEGLSSIFVRRN